MNPALDYLLGEINQRIESTSPVREKLITSGRHFSGWLRERIQHDHQILINAIICPRSEMQDRLGYVIYEIKKEFNPTDVHPLPYPYDDIQKMKVVIDGLIQYFKSSISADEVIQTLRGSASSRDELQGYLILTLVETPVIS